MRFVVYLAILSAISAFGYLTYKYHELGYHHIPEKFSNSETMVFDNGIKAIYVDVDIDRKNRKYFSFIMDVPTYLKNHWSECSLPTPEEEKNAKVLPGARLEALCWINADDDVIFSGLVYSSPR